MKKFLCATLASAMALSMASVAFAKEAPKTVEFFYENDSKRIDFEVGGEDVFDPAIVKDFKISYDFDEGAEYVEDVSFDVKRTKNDKGESDVNLSKYYIDIDTDFKNSTKNIDVIGTVTIKASKSKYLFGDDAEITIDVAFTYDPFRYGKEEFEGKHLYDFEGYKADSQLDDEEECELEIFNNGYDGRFVVDTRGQKNMWIKANVDYSAGIENVDPDVAYTYYNSNNPVFNKLGTLYLRANEGDVLYNVADNGELVKVDEKLYDADEEAFVIRTREIGDYVVAEKELSAEALVANVPAPEAPVAPVVPSNPSTGAAC